MTNVVFLRLKRRQVEGFGKRAHGPTVFEVSELFTKFGDINVSKFFLKIIFESAISFY